MSLILIKSCNYIIFLMNIWKIKEKKYLPALRKYSISFFLSWSLSWKPRQVLTSDTSEEQVLSVPPVTFLICIPETQNAPWSSCQDIYRIYTSLWNYHPPAGQMRVKMDSGRWNH